MEVLTSTAQTALIGAQENPEEHKRFTAKLGYVCRQIRVISSATHDEDLLDHLLSTAKMHSRAKAAHGRVSSFGIIGHETAARAHMLQEELEARQQCANSQQDEWYKIQAVNRAQHEDKLKVIADESMADVPRIFLEMVSSDTDA